MWDSVTSAVSNFWNEFVIAVSSFIAAAIIQISIKVSKRIRRWLKYNALPEQISTALNVNTLLTEAKLATGADRAYVYQFSNGTYYSNDVSQLNMTCTHEVVREGVTTIGPQKAEILVTQLPHLFHKLVQGDSMVMRTDDLHDYHWKQMLKDRGTVIFRAIPILNSRSQLEGWMGLDFLAPHDDLFAHIDENGEVDNSQTDLVKIAQRIGHTLRI